MTHTMWQAEELVDLLLTNSMEYDIACPLDIVPPGRFYDTWVARDIFVRRDCVVG